MLAFKGESQQVRYDMKPWVEDNGTITSYTIEVINGQASISNDSLDKKIELQGQFGLLSNEISSALGGLSVFAGQSTIGITGSPVDDGVYNITTVIDTKITTDGSFTLYSGVLTLYSYDVSNIINNYDLVNVLKFNVDTPESGASLIRITIITNTNTLVTHLRVVAKDPSVIGSFPTDYV
jgi:hypothetical protein